MDVIIMKIEKINDSQIKFILSKTDLKSRNIELSDLAYGSEKTQQLFHDIIQKAFEDYNFNTSNTPTMIEAIPVSKTSIMIVVTKIKNPLEIEEKISSIYHNQAPLVKSNSTVFKSINSILSIYCFKTLDDIINMITKISNRISDVSSSLYKYDCEYYLVFYVNSNNDAINNLDYIISEYTDKCVTNNKLFISHLSEHGELLIGDMAVQKLSRI
ncbi:MAG TPA: hypothetical protein DCP90_09275 [Clostridiales bacterium]|nr:hypothetical protein [Clostridiales bacterium]